MILLLSGASHVGKTLLAQRLLERLHFPYLSIDHLKMGLIRSGHTHLTPLSDEEELTNYLWPIVREIIKTAIENRQNLTVEGCYVPVNWAQDFDEEYRKEIRFLRLAFSEDYLRKHFDLTKLHACDAEQRLDDSYYTLEEALADNRAVLERSQAGQEACFVIENSYEASIERAIRGLID